MIDNTEFNKILDMVISDIPITNDDFVYGITFVGPPGVGKSTISDILSKRLNVYVTANDKIRRILDSLGIDGAKNQPLVEQLAYARSKYMLDNRTSMIIDANCLTAYKSVDENFGKHNVPCFYIRLECDEEEILRRIDEREKNFSKNDNYSRATRKDYYNYLHREEDNPFPSEKEFFKINTGTDLDPQIDELVEKINNYIKVNKKRNL